MGKGRDFNVYKDVFLFALFSKFCPRSANFFRGADTNPKVEVYTNIL